MITLHISERFFTPIWFLQLISSPLNGITPSVLPKQGEGERLHGGKENFEDACEGNRKPSHKIILSPSETEIPRHFIVYLVIFLGGKNLCLYYQWWDRSSQVFKINLSLSLSHSSEMVHTLETFVSLRTWGTARKLLRSFITPEYLEIVNLYTLHPRKHWERL